MKLYKTVDHHAKGRPRKHGQKFKLNDPSTWWEATESIEVEDAQLGQLRVRRWKDLHFSGSASCVMELILVERVEVGASPSQSKPLWLVWVGQSMPPLGQIWRKYLRRFAVDHWYRFLKQRLHWTTPQLSTPHQCERWSDLMPIMTWELWLAKDLVAQYHLPWQKPPKEFDSWTGSSVHGFTFARDWYTSYFSQTSWKVSPFGQKGTSVLKGLVIPWSKKVKHDTKSSRKKPPNTLLFRK